MFVTCCFTVTAVCLPSVLLLVQYATHYGHYVSVFPLWTLVEKTCMSNHSQTANLQKTAHLARCLQLPARVLDLVVGSSKRLKSIKHLAGGVITYLNAASAPLMTSPDWQK